MPVVQDVLDTSGQEHPLALFDSLTVVANMQSADSVSGSSKTEIKSLGAKHLVPRGERCVVATPRFESACWSAEFVSARSVNNSVLLSDVNNEWCLTEKEHTGPSSWRHRLQLLRGMPPCKCRHPQRAFSSVNVFIIMHVPFCLQHPCSNDLS